MVHIHVWFNPAFATIPVRWHDAANTVELGERQGQFPNMLKRRTFRVVRVAPYHGVGEDATPDEEVDAEVVYSGSSLNVTVEPA